MEQDNGQRYKMVERIATAKKARTGLFDSEAGRLYVVLPAHDGEGPSVQVYQAKP